MSRLAKLSPTWFTFGLVLVLRALVAASRLDVLELEAYGSSLATALLAGMPLDPEQLPIIAHLRGSVLFGVLLVPLSAVLGNGLVAVKLLAILWSAATGALLASLLTRCVGRVGGFAAGLAFACAPPSFVMVDVLALGSHGDTILFVFLAFWYLLVGCERGPRTWRQMAILGALCGAGYWFSMQFLVALPAIVGAWWFVDRRGLLRVQALALPLAAAPFALLAPIVSGGTQLVTKPTSAHFFAEGVGGAVLKLSRALRYELRRAWLFEEHGGAWVSWLLLAVVLVALVLLARRLRRGEPLAFALGLYAAGFVGAYAVSDFQLDFFNTLSGMGSRYAMPLWAALAGVLGLAAATLAELRTPRLAAGYTALACAPGLLGLASLLDLSTAWRQPPALGHRLALFDYHFEYAAEHDLERQLEWVLELDPDWSATHPFAYRNFALPDARVRWSNRFQLARDLVRVRDYDPRLRPYLLIDLGRRAVLQRDLREELTHLDELANLLTQEELDWFVRGAGMDIVPEMVMARLADARRTGREAGAPEARRNQLAFLFAKSLPAQYRQAAVEGIGFFTGMNSNPYQQTMLDVSEDAEVLPPELHEVFFHALGQGYRRRFRESTFWVPEVGELEVERRMSDRAREAFRAGLAAPHEEFVRLAD